MSNVIVSTFTVPDWRFGGTTCKLRLYANQDWTDNLGFPHMGGAIGSANGFYQEINCTISGTTITVPQFTTPATLDSHNPETLITGVLFDSRGARRKNLFSNWVIPASTPATWEFLWVFNSQRASTQSPLTYLAAIQELIELATEGIFEETFSGDGVTSAFSLARTPVAGSEAVFLNGIRQTRGSLGAGTESYTLSGNVITHNLPPQVGDRLVVTYRTTSGLVGNGLVPTQVQTSNGVVVFGDIDDGAFVKREGSTFVSGGTREVVSVITHGAVGDGITDDSAAFTAAATAALAARLPLYFPTGDYLLAATAGTEFLLITKGIEVFGDGMSTSRLIIDSAVGSSKDVIRISPPVTAGAVPTWLINSSRDNTGFYFHDFAILSENEQIVQVDPYPSQPARDAIVVDVSTADQYVYGISFERIQTGSLGRYGMNFNNSNGAGGQRNQDGIWGLRIHDCTIRNGILGQFWGDSVEISATYMMGQNAGIESWQTSGATTLNIIGCNMTNRGGGLICHNGLGINLMNCIIEMYVVPSTGSNGAAVDFRGDVAEIQRINIRGNEINTHVVGNEMNGIRLDNVNTVQIDQNTFRGRNTKFGVVTTASAINPIYGLNYVESTGGAGFVLLDPANADPFPVHLGYTINLEPDVATPATFIPHYLGVEKLYPKLLRVPYPTSPALPVAGEGLEAFGYADGRVNNGAVETTGGSGVGVLQSRNRDAVAYRDLFIGGAKGLLLFEQGMTWDSGTASATAGAATLNKQSGTITSESLTTAAGADYVLTLTNSLITATSKVFVSVDNGSNTTEGIAVNRVTPGSGSVVIRIRNTHAASALNGTIKISFVVF